MRPHLSLNVRNVSQSVSFYSKVFGIPPQKQTTHYAKFDLTEPPLNFSLSTGEKAPSRVNHLGIEVDEANKVSEWKSRLEESGIKVTTEENSDCCFARQDKVWFQDPDGNPWEVFYVYEQLPVVESKKGSGCCAGSGC